MLSRQKKTCNINVLKFTTGDPGSVEMSYQEFKDKSLLKRLILPPVSRNDFLKALQKCSSSVKQEDIQKCIEFTQNYGMNGM